MEENTRRALEKEKELWNKIEESRKRMVQIATEKQLNFLHPEVLEASQHLNRLLDEYEKLLHKQSKLVKLTIFIVNPKERAYHSNDMLSLSFIP